MHTAIWWIRRDLRLGDNQALAAAISHAEKILPVFVLDPHLLASPYVGEKRLAFLFAGLRALNIDLAQRGSYLVVRSGDPISALVGILHEIGADAIYAEADYSPYARRRDQRAAQSLPVHFTPGLTVHSPVEIVKTDGTPYSVFTPFSRTWLGLPWAGESLSTPGRIPTPPGIQSEGIPAMPQLPVGIPYAAGEAEAQRRLEAFTEKAISHYAQDRNRMDLPGTSGLSPYLRFGMISARQAVAAARRVQAQAVDGDSLRGAETWLNELIWREFYTAILYHFPYVRQAAFRPSMRNLAWVNNLDDFAAWAKGCTGYPVVDAAMRQLVQTGWMHNRARMITASFLTKDLLVDWRWGEKYFMQHLIDGDPAANNGGWQWTAGTGTDAAPYFRVFNPELQSLKYDPEGTYIRRFVPELSNVPHEYIHAPWRLPLEVQKRIGCQIGEDYPAPMVDHKLARQRTLRVYAAS